MLNCWISHTIKSFSEKCFNAGVQTHQTYWRHPTVGYCISHITFLYKWPKANWYEAKTIFAFYKIWKTFPNGGFSSPDSATASIGTFCSYAMKPKTEKMANPATKLVPLFRQHSMMQSLQTHTATAQMQKYSPLFRPSLDSQHWTTVDWSTEKRLFHVKVI